MNIKRSELAEILLALDEEINPQNYPDNKGPMPDTADLIAETWGVQKELEELRKSKNYKNSDTYEQES